MLLDDLNEYLKFLQPTTTSLAIRGNSLTGKCPDLTQGFFNTVRTVCNQLKELIIEEYYISEDKVHILTIRYI